LNEAATRRGERSFCGFALWRLAAWFGIGL
jgi:hypothetical protein